MKHVIYALTVLLFLLSFSCQQKTIQKECMEKIDPECTCTMQYDPVCGCNNKTYGNACVAECSGIKDYTPGECP